LSNSQKNVSPLIKNKKESKSKLKINRLCGILLLIGELVRELYILGLGVGIKY